VLEVPRSVRLAAWGSAVLAGSARAPVAVRAVMGDDEPHDVVAEPPLGDVVEASRSNGTTPLEALLLGLRDRGVRRLRVVLPAPGDVLGLPGPPDFNTEALEAGECVLTEPIEAPGRPGGDPSARWGLIPVITTFGSVWEPGSMVSWHVRAVGLRGAGQPAGLGEAERELTQALHLATDELARLDVARWRDDAAGRVEAVRDGAIPAGVLPPAAGARPVRVLGTAARVRAIVALASEDDGAAITGYEAQRRADTLRDLDAVSRRAVMAAVNAMTEGRA
jgi:hypothetical protein